MKATFSNCLSKRHERSAGCRGSATVQYCLLVGMVAVSTISSVRIMATTVSDRLTIVGPLQGALVGGGSEGTQDGGCFAVENQELPECATSGMENADGSDQEVVQGGIGSQYPGAEGPP